MNLQILRSRINIANIDKHKNEKTTKKLNFNFNYKNNNEAYPQVEHWAEPNDVLFADVPEDNGAPLASVHASNCSMILYIDGRCDGSCCQHCCVMSRKDDGVSVILMNNEVKYNNNNDDDDDDDKTLRAGICNSSFDML